MMQKNYLRFLESESNKLGKNREIFDILLYGSSAKAKKEANDIDILIIFKKKPLKERTEIAQDFKKKISVSGKVLDIKTINLPEIFENSFLARQAILIEGYSLISRVPFSGKMGFSGHSLFTYELKNLNHNNKTRFTYSLIGRFKQPGMLKKLNAKPLGKGVVLIPIQNSSFFDDFLRKWKINYIQKNILVSEL
ncbi:MAG: nucleotidyltransferase domain-containing protein [Nanoarchaeota archaeon]